MSAKAPRIIGLTGYAQAGKSTVAAVLEGLGYKRLSFAGPLKSMALAVDPIVEFEFDHEGGDYLRLAKLVELRGWEFAKTLPEVRRFLQALGTEGVRGHLGENSWVNAFMRQVQPGGRYTADDVRFRNEAYAVTSSGGEVWKVVRPGFDNGVGTGHASEAEVDTLTHHVLLINEGTKEELEQLVKDVVGARGLA